jgi:hypothetical protein
VRFVINATGRRLAVALAAFAFAAPAGGAAAAPGVAAVTPGCSATPDSAHSVPMPAVGISAALHLNAGGGSGGFVLAAVGADGATYFYFADGVVFGTADTGRLVGGTLACLGGTAVGRPGVTVYRGRHQVMVRGAGDNLYLRSFDPVRSVWSGWGVVPSAQALSGPALTTFFSETYGAVRGTDNAVYLLHMLPNGRWVRPEALGGAAGDSPAVDTLGDSLVVSVRGTDGGTYVKSGLPGHWSRWTRLPGGAGSGAPVLMTQEAGIGQPPALLVLGTDGFIATSTYAAQSGSWSAFTRVPLFGPYPAGTPIGAALAGQTTQGQDRYVFAVLADRVEYAKLGTGPVHPAAPYLCGTCGMLGID